MSDQEHEHRPCDCGKKVVLRGRPMRVNGTKGVAHWLEHADGTRLCHGGFTSYSSAPYPAQREDKPHVKMLAKWDSQ